MNMSPPEMTGTSWLPEKPEMSQFGTLATTVAGVPAI
jgi:hypothetical protein